MTGWRFKARWVIDSILNNKGTHLILTPTMAIDILNYIEQNNVKLNTLKSVVMGGAPVPMELANRIHRVIPSVKDVRVAYGATEQGPVSTFPFADDSLENRVETVGKLFRRVLGIIILSSKLPIRWLAFMSNFDEALAAAKMC